MENLDLATLIQQFTENPTVFIGSLLFMWIMPGARTFWKGISKGLPKKVRQFSNEMLDTACETRLKNRGKLPNSD